MKTAEEGTIKLRRNNLKNKANPTHKNIWKSNKDKDWIIELINRKNTQMLDNIAIKIKNG